MATLEANESSPTRLPRVAFVVGRGIGRGLPDTVASFARYRGIASALGLASGIQTILQPKSWLSATYEDSNTGAWYSRVPKVRVLFEGLNVNHWLESLSPRPDLILLFETNPVYYFWVVAWAKRHRVPLIIDVRDWYKPKDVPGLRNQIMIALNNVAVRLPARSVKGAVAVSSLLERHLEDKGLAVLRMPAVMELSHEGSGVAADNSRQEGFLKVGFVGNPGKRDWQSVAVLLDIAEQWVSPDIFLEVVLAGPRQPSTATNGEMIFPRARVSWLGHVSRQEALAVVAGVDFTVLIRPSERYAQAGFPSKVAESLLVGTPVISNSTSDLADFLFPGVNGEILTDPTADSLLTILENASRHLQRYDRAAIRRLAQEEFSPLGVSGRLEDFCIEMVRRFPRVGGR